jgi:hypothetical protein
MTEILTESFCERCGTRYTFESARPHTRLKGVKVLSRGLKNFVMSDETSMDEAMAAARSETDRELTSHQLDAFHKTFNFCMSCRQYTCPNCWNEAEARCLSCAPHLGQEVLPAPFPDMPVTPSFLVTGANGTNGANGAAHPAELVGAAEVAAVHRDDEVDFAARLATLTAPTVEPPPAVIEDVATEVIGEPEAIAEAEAVEPEAIAEAEAVEPIAPIPYVDVEPEAVANAATVEQEAVAEAQTLEPIAPIPYQDMEPSAPVEPVLATSAEPEVAAEAEAAADDPELAARLAALAAAAVVADAVTPDEAAPNISVGDKAAGQTSGLFQRFRPGQNLDAELAAYERDIAAESPDTTQPDVTATDAGTEELAAAATAQPATEPDAAPAAPAPVVDDLVPQPVWQMVAPDPGVDGQLGQPGETPAMPAAASSAPPSAEPQWPTQPQWPASNAANGLPFLGRPATPQGGLEALWAESNREVVATPGGAGRTAGVVQPCVSCGLSLSATARFCRRCGTPQAV